MINPRFEEIRAREFEGTGRAIYLNAAGFGLLPNRTRTALNQFNERRYRGELRDVDLFPVLDNARAQAARLIGASAQEIALTPNTNVALNIAANAVLERVHDRSTILLHDGEFPANVYPWLALQQHGFTVELLPLADDGKPQEELMLARIAAGDVAAVAVSFVQFSSGFRADLAALSQACAQTDTLLIVDAIQGLGIVPLDVSETPIDILACGAQKWLCSPWGSGFAYVRAGLIRTFDPVFPGWLSFHSSHDFRSLTSYEYDLLDDARRFETGSIAYQDHLGMALSIEVLQELSVAAIAAHVRDLQQPVIDWARAHGVPISSDLSESRRSGILCIRPTAAEQVHARLTEAGVVCALREGAIRLAAHWYNTAAEMERLVDILHSATK